MTIESPPNAHRWPQTGLPGLSCEAALCDHAAHEAAVAALQAKWPLPRKEASAEAVNAIAHATRDHSDWIWRGRQHEGKPCVRPQPAG